MNERKVLLASVFACSLIFSPAVSNAGGKYGGAPGSYSNLPSSGGYSPSSQPKAVQSQSVNSGSGYAGASYSQPASAGTRSAGATLPSAYSNSKPVGLTVSQPPQSAPSQQQGFKAVTYYGTAPQAQPQQQQSTTIQPKTVQPQSVNSGSGYAGASYSQPTSAGTRSAGATLPSAYSNSKPVGLTVGQPQSVPSQQQVFKAVTYYGTAPQAQAQQQRSTTKVGTAAATNYTYTVGPDLKTIYGNKDVTQALGTNKTMYRKAPEASQSSYSGAQGTTYPTVIYGDGTNSVSGKSDSAAGKVGAAAATNYTYTVGPDLKTIYGNKTAAGGIGGLAADVSRYQLGTPLPGASTTTTATNTPVRQDHALESWITDTGGLVIIADDNIDTQGRATVELDSSGRLTYYYDPWFTLSGSQGGGLGISQFGGLQPSSGSFSLLNTVTHPNDPFAQYLKAVYSVSAYGGSNIVSSPYGPFSGGYYLQQSSYYSQSGYGYNQYPSSGYGYAPSYSGGYGYNQYPSGSYGTSGYGYNQYPYNSGYGAGYGTSATSQLDSELLKTLKELINSWQQKEALLIGALGVVLPHDVYAGFLSDYFKATGSSNTTIEEMIGDLLYSVGSAVQTSSNNGVVNISGTSGQRLSLLYNDSGLIDSVTLGEETLANFAYDEETGEVVYMENPDGSECYMIPVVRGGKCAGKLVVIIPDKASYDINAISSAVSASSFSLTAGPSAISNASVFSTNFIYKALDSTDRMLWEKYADGSVVRHLYPASGGALVVTIPSGKSLDMTRVATAIANSAAFKFSDGVGAISDTSTFPEGLSYLAKDNEDNEIWLKRNDNIVIYFFRPANNGTLTVIVPSGKTLNVASLTAEIIKSNFKLLDGPSAINNTSVFPADMGYSAMDSQSKILWDKYADGSVVYYFSNEKVGTLKIALSAGNTNLNAASVKTEVEKTDFSISSLFSLVGTNSIFPAGFGYEASDLLGRPLWKKRQDGSTEVCEYDASGYLIKRTNVSAAPAT
ncbi:MAG: hypothetical protein V1753_08385, partial [Pseudomonadota bacterium]